MSAIHPGNLHGTGTRTNKTRYHYARQRVQDAQKVKSDESTVTKKEEPEIKSSNTTVLVILLVLTCITWGIAATAWFGIVDYKGLLARSSNISAADATDYASSLYPFQYEAVRHPLKSIGSLLTFVDDTITNFFTFTKAPYQIIDKRRTPTISPVRRMKEIVDLAKKEAATGERKGPIPAQGDTAQKDQVDVDQPGAQEAPEEPKQAKTTTDKPKSSKDETRQDPEKQRDVSLTLNLHLFVGQHHTINESHLVSESGSVLQIGTKSAHKPKKDSENAPKCAKNETKQLFFKTLPINKANIAFCNGNPPVPRLVLEDSTQNPLGYIPPIRSSPPSLGGFVQEGGKLVVASAPVNAEISPEIHENISPFFMTTETHNNIVSKFGEKLVVDTSNFKYSNKNSRKARNFASKSCTKSCSSSLNSFDKNSIFKNHENQEIRDKIYSRITLPGIVPKIPIKYFEKTDSKQKFSKQKFFSRITLPTVLPKYPVRNSYNSYSDQEFSVRITHPNVLPKNAIRNSCNTNSGQKFSGRIILPSVAPRNPFKKSESRNSEETFVFFGKRIALANPTNKYFQYPLKKDGNSAQNSRSEFGTPVEGKPDDSASSEAIKVKIERIPSSDSTLENGKNFRQTILSSVLNRCLVNVRRFIGRRIISRRISNTILSKIIRNMRYSLRNGMKSRSVANPCSERMIWHIVKHSSAKVSSRKIRNPIIEKNLKLTRLSPRRIVMNRTVLPPPAPKIIQRSRGFVTSQKMRSRDLSNPTVRRVIRNADVLLDRRCLSRSTINPTFEKIKENNDKLRLGKRKMLVRVASNPTCNRVTLKVAPSSMVRGTLRRNVVRNPFLGKLGKDSQQRIINRKVCDGVASILRFSKFVHTAMVRERQMLFLRLATAGTEAFTRRISVIKQQNLSEKPEKTETEIKLSPKQKLKRKFSRMFDRTCDVISAVASVIAKLNIFDKAYEILPQEAKNWVIKSKNVTVISKLIEISLNTTLNDVILFAKESSLKIWYTISEKGASFYKFLNQKPSFRNFFARLSKFCQKMQQKYEKTTDMVAKNFVKLEHNQKLLTSILITLSVIGLYHIFYSCVNSIFPARR